MNVAMPLTTARGWSRILAVLSAQADAHAAAGQFVCGIGAFALFAVCMLAAGALSLLAMALAAVGYLRAPKPRSRGRRIELLAVGHFFILAAGYMAVAKLAG